MAKKKPLDRTESALAKRALTYPTVVEDNPWGERAFKVKGKVFVFLSRHDGKLNYTIKLPESAKFALSLPFAQPTGYGLGKHGWVTCTFGPEDDAPVDLLEEWMAESFRAVAPKSVLKLLDE